MFKVGDVIEPTDEAEDNYGVTCKPSMTKGIVLKVKANGYISIKITEGEEADDYRDTDFDVQASYFKLITPLTKDSAFESLVKGSITDAEYEEAIKKLNKNT